MEKLQKLYDSLKKTSIPPFSGIDEFDDWIENLIEADTFLAGFACSILNGEKIQKTMIPNVDYLEKSFLILEKNNTVNEKFLGEAKIYLKLLGEIHEQLLLNAM